MKHLYSLIIALLAIVAVHATEPDSAASPKQHLQAEKLTSSIKIDGSLDEPVWNNLIPIVMYQSTPDEGKPASEKTFAKIYYDEDAIYFGARMEDSKPDSVIGRVVRRDGDLSSDFIGLFLDPYKDGKTGYFFIVNPSGSFVDGTMYNTDWTSDSWNGIWEGKAKTIANGWTVEMRIPLSQLRYNHSSVMTWGFDIRRDIQRKMEVSHTFKYGRKDNGYVSRFNELQNIKTESAPKRLEILPYIVQKAQYLVHDENDPYYKSKQYVTNIGADIKYGIGSNLTLDATINPDFGQVEVDPAVLNLGAFETWYQEKRPFFTEGENLLDFGSSGSNSNWNFNWGNTFFYSRRIGGMPHGWAQHEGYSDYPSETKILGAAKLTGKIADGWNLYVLNAITPETTVRTDSAGVTFKDIIEPITNYTVIRSMREFNGGKQALGIMGTATVRSLNGTPLNDILADKAFFGGVDGWTFLDEKKTYILTGYLAGSYKSGSKEYIKMVQEQPQHYLQRPDRVNSRLDTNLTSLSGMIGRVTFNKQNGNFYVNSAIGFVTAGFDVNDLGFQHRSDQINGHVVLGYKEYEPDGVFRSKRIFGGVFTNFNLDGIRDNIGAYTNFNVELMQYFGIGGNVSYSPKHLTTGVLRGGPMVMYPEAIDGGLWTYSDGRKPLVWYLNGYASVGSDGGSYYNFQPSVEWKIGDNLKISFEPSYTYNDDKLMWVTAVDDAQATSTYGRRYVLSNLLQRTYSASFRADWSFTPQMTLQLYMQPYFTAGKYTEFKEIENGSSDSYLVYGRHKGTIAYSEANNEYTIDPDGSGPANSFTIGNPDFNFKSIKINLVFRWEFMPGSTCYFVWTHNQMNTADPADLQLGRDFSNLMKSDADNIFLVKFNYWFNL